LVHGLKGPDKRRSALIPHLDSISSLQAGRARLVVPSAAFLSTGATRRGFGRPASMRSSAGVLIRLPAGMPSRVAKPVTQPVRIEKHRSPGRT
jgi:hypothetical protein